MGCCEGKKIDLTSLLSPDQQTLQSKMIAQALGKVGQGATPYPGAMTSAIDPMQLMAASIMMGMQGKPYNAPPMLGASGMTGIGGTGGGGGGFTPPYRQWGRGGGGKDEGQEGIDWGGGGGGGGNNEANYRDWMERGRRGGRFG